MVHLNFGNFSRPTGRIQLGHNYQNVNINSYEKNVYGGYPMGSGMYGMGSGMYGLNTGAFPTPYGMPQMGGCCHGHGHNSWGVGDTLMALGSLATGFFGSFGGGGSSTVETDESKTNTKQMEAFQETIKQIQEEHKKANEARNQEIAALKAQVQAALEQLKNENDPTSTAKWKISHF